MPAIAHITAEMPDPVAEIEYQMMLDFEPGDILTRYKLAMVYYRLKKNDLAEKELKTVLNRQPNHFLSLEGMGMLLVRQHKYQQAVGLLRKAAAHKDKESGTYYYLGKALQGLGKIEAAKVSYQEGMVLLKSEPKKKQAISEKVFQESLLSLQQTN